MNRATTRLISLLISLALLIGAIVSFTSFVIPSYESINELRGTLRVKSDLVEQQQKIVDDVRMILSQFESVASLKETVGLSIPTSAAHPTLINQVTGLAQSAGLLLRSVGVSDASGGIGFGEPATPTLGKTRLNLEMNGTYEAFNSFLRTIETNVRLLDVASIGVGSAAPGSNALTYQVAITAYHQTPVGSASISGF